jgi:3-phenylpropionate/trans-cinnamate dioxygenase ferredoxin reductase subunit
VVDRLDSVLVVGGGLAGLRACEVLRQHGFEGRLALIGAEKHLPYDRPPLSKQLLSGAWDTERCTLRSSAELETLGLELHLGSAAAHLDMAARSVVLVDGRAFAFDGLVIATGATPRPLAGITGRPAVLTLRDLDDAVASGRSSEDPVLGSSSPGRASSASRWRRRHGDSAPTWSWSSPSRFRSSERSESS